MTNLDSEVPIFVTLCDSKLAVVNKKLAKVRNFRFLAVWWSATTVLHCGLHFFFKLGSVLTRNWCMLGFLRKPLGAREVSIFELSNQWPRWSTASTVGFLLSWTQTWLSTPFHFFTAEYLLATLLQASIVLLLKSTCCSENLRSLWARAFMLLEVTPEMLGASYSASV